MVNTSQIIVFVALFSSATGIVSAQAPAKWSVEGNAAANGDFLGTTNNQPLIFYTNNQEAMRIKPNGEFKVSSLGGFGSGLVTVNNNGVVNTRPFTSDTSQVLFSDGIFRPLNTVTGWQRLGPDLYTANPGNVGIGTNSPLYKLDVNGNARVNGMLYINGLHIMNAVNLDTLKSSTIIEVDNSLCLMGGTSKGICTKTGDLLLQSRQGLNGNTVLNYGTTGNVGIGTNDPQYKLDVDGDVRINGRLYVYRIAPLSGDSLIRFGDSTMILNTVNSTIYSTVGSGNKGIGIGQFAFGSGLSSCAIGYRVVSANSAVNAVTIGSGATGSPFFTNSISNSLMVGFNATVPTFFVGAADGPGTIGRVGVGTSNPQDMFQVGDAHTKITAGPAANIATTFSTAYIGFNTAHAAPGQWQSQGNGSGNGGVVLLSDINGGFRIASIPSNSGLAQSIGDAMLQSNTSLYIRADGRVIIGKEQITPGGIYDDANTRMTVNGRIMCKDLVVSTVADWPDFVFDSAYALMPMDSLGQYIAYYKHLPGTPPAQVQEQQGISLAETCRKQQLQIEELTLYILQLNERMKALEAEKQKTK